MNGTGLAERRHGHRGTAPSHAGRPTFPTPVSAREFFNSRAADWDLTQDPYSVRKSRELARSLPIEPGSKVLDVGCGTGVLIPWLLEAVGPEGSVCALDIAERMLEVARRKFSSPNLFYLHGDIASAPFLENLFDLVVCHNCFPHLADKQGAVGEMFRVLKPGGRVVISHTESRKDINARHCRMGGALEGDMLPGEEAMRRLFRDAGFVAVRIRDGEDGYMLQAHKPAAALA